MNGSDFNSDDSIMDKDYVQSDTETTSDISDTPIIITPIQSTSNTRRQSSAGSKFSKFFEYIQINGKDKIAVCNLCKLKNIKSKIKMTQSNTSGLKKHLMAKHRQQYNNLFPQSTTTNTSDSGSKLQNQSILNFLSNDQKRPTQKMFDEMIIDWIAVKYLPYSFFDDSKTQELFKFLNDTIKVPKRTTLHKNVDQRYDAMKVAISQIIKSNDSNISFTIDGWTSIANKSFYGITAHFIDQNWNLQSIVIDFIPSNGNHTGKHIANLFMTCIKEFKIETKIQGITVDNASANTTFMDELAKLLQESGIDFVAEDHHFRCIAHILNLGVQDILKLIKAEPDETDLENINIDQYDVSTSVNKLRILFLKLKRSEQWNNKLRSCCDALNIAVRATNIDVSTRWNSTNDLIKIAFLMKPALNALCENNDELNNLKLSISDWHLLEEIYKILKHFKTLSTLLGGEHYATLPMVIVGFNILLDKIETEITKLNNKENRSSVEEKLMFAYDAGRNKLLKHYKKTNWIYCVVLILDPRHKVETFNLTSWGREMLDSTVKKFEDIYKSKYYIAPQTRQYNEINSQPSFSSSQNDDDEMMDFDLTLLYENENNISDDWRKEICTYLNAKRADKNVEILSWWKNHSNVYPTLSKMARDFLCTPATSVPAERLFSNAGLTIRKQRNRLSAESAKSLLCLNSWCTIIP